ncbi:hypothetical protein [Paenirhodobacter populi]|uniref:hypothetical protein n=1 Tax=Paenirhodobacter populi TaxID=2306993 RepID=UPI0013E2EC0D|nr:hypothetical protein [Sinirhodobacter populi]
MKPGDGPELDYDEWLAAELNAGLAELDAGKGIPAKEVWQSLGLEWSAPTHIR